MSTIDEVLAAAEVVDAVCVIDGETRIISVPTEYKELGVESDEKVTRIKFRCPKIVGDNVDLTEYNLYINYRNAANKLNSYLIEDVTVTGDTINFSWLLSRHVTENPGTISYIVCAKKSDNTGVINEWNTKVATGIVGIGLEATEEIEEQNIDAIEQILRSIVELENNIGGGGSGGSGEAGGYYAPTVDDDGNLIWTASKADMPAVDGANIKGPAGQKGDKGDKGDTGAAGADGKSAYAYAVEGGYTGTEAEFAAKLAAEKVANPYALTFTGAATGSYDGAAALTVNIPSGGGGEKEWRIIRTITIGEDVESIDITTDDDGNTFSCEEIFIHTNATNIEGTTTALSLGIRPNGNLSTINSTNSAFALGAGKTGETGRSWAYIASLNPVIAFAATWITTSTVSGKTVTVTNVPVGISGNPFSAGEKITSLRFVCSSSSMGISAGSKFEIYGR